MSEFARKFKIGELLDLNFDWLNELLSLSKPSGVGRDDLEGSPLRIAVRDRYLNFYYEGQSIAKVQFDKNGTPYMATHGKYLLSEKQLDARKNRKKDQFHGRLFGGCDRFLIDDGSEVPYTGIKDLIQKSKNYSGDEKKFVENLVSCNSNIIDLEMAIPCPGVGGKRDVALRLDAVSLEEVEGKIKIVFWEAKLHSDSRCRASGSTPPKVIEQLKRYRRFTADSVRQKEVIEAYIQSASVLSSIYGSKLNEKISRLAKLANKPGVTANEVFVASEPRLIIDCREIEKSGDARRIAYWAKHVRKLQDHKVKFELIKSNDDLSVIGKST